MRPAAPGAGVVPNFGERVEDCAGQSWRYSPGMKLMPLMWMKSCSVLLPAAALLLGTLAPARAADAPAAKMPFFAFENAMHDGKTRPPAEQAALLKELGYDGVSASGQISAEYIAAFESAGLKVFNTYLVLSFDSAKPGLEPKLKEFVARLKGHGTALWIAIQTVTKDGVKLKPSAPEGDEVVLPAVRELAALAEASGVRIAFYPHTWMWTERVEDCVRVARKAERANVGATFNLCHWLKVEGDRDPRPVLQDALPKLFFVSINGAEAGDTKKLDWNKLIQPLGQGSYDVAGLVKMLKEIGYTGSIGFQGFAIKGDSRDILTQTMQGWRRIGL